MNKDWYIDWFNSKYYHVLYKSRNQLEASNFINILCNHLNMKAGNLVLDLACGRGRHTIQLAKQGYLSTGLDLSEQSILKAKEKVIKMNIKGAHFDLHDMRNVYKRDYFDYALNLFTSFGYFENAHDNIKVLNSAYESLINKGLFVIDFFNMQKVVKNLVSIESKEIDSIIFNIKRSFDGSHITKNIHVNDKNKNIYFQEKVNAFNLKDFKKMANLSGFDIIKVFGNYQLKKFEENHSDRLIMVLKKNKTNKSIF